ncbi:MAG: hypothetical protein LBC70_08665 [Chitinispirillales bacterium]|jgi:M6 family metalloprotease-like protein|nr:hypothetical protein [Chitinispirillales bacterium]
MERLVLVGCRSSFLTKVFTIIAVVVFLAAAGYNGEPMLLSQPDGSEVTVHLFGTPFFSTAESPDGFTLIRDEDGWICYAELSADGSELVSTGVRYTATSRSPIPAARRGLRINDRSVMEQRNRNVRALGDGEEESNRRFWDKAERHERRRAARGGDNPSASEEDDFQHAPREVVGLALFISFPDFPGPTGEVNARWLRHADSVYNSPEYTRGSGAGYGSVYSYFQDISSGLMSVKNYVSVFVQAPQPFTYYDGVDNYGRVSELITEALRILNQNTAVANEIASRVSRHPGTHGQKSRPAYALNIHPIRSGQRWSHGIWSHRGWYRGSQTVGGVPFYDYQFSGLGNAGNITATSTLSTGVIIHENGHMLFDWPDLYSYVSGRNFVVQYCTMSSGTVMPNPFFRDLEGWLTVTDVTAAPGLYTHQANSNTAFVFRRTDVTGTNANRERYYIESRFANGRSTGIPGSGLIVWHIHNQGNNANYDPNDASANRRTPRVAIVQANNGTGNPNAQSTFTNASGRNLFNRLPGDNSTPQRRWHTQNGATGGLWGGTSGTGGTNAPVSGLVISEISAAPTTSNPRMTFRIGSGDPVPPPTFQLTVVNGTGGGNYRADTTITITASTTTSNPRFMRWTSSRLTPENVYFTTTTVRTADPGRADTVTAVRMNRIDLPGTVQADSFGFATSITAAAVTGATGGRAARVTAGTGRAAEYLVRNTSPAGTYRITYRVSSQRGGRFFVRDMTNGTRIDTVIVPATGATGNGASAAVWQEVGPRVRNIANGQMVWRIESDTGTYDIDRIVVSTVPATFALTVINGTGSGSYEAGTSVDITAPNQNADAGGRFMRWASSRLTPASVYSNNTTVTTAARADTVRAVYAGVFAIPGSIEADTFGYAESVSGVSSTNATGGRAANFNTADGFAEYFVNPAAAGLYTLSYRYASSGGGRLILRDVTNDVILDTIAASATGGNNTYRTIIGRNVQLTSGRAIWRVEYIDGACRFDWFAVNETVTALTVDGGSGSGDYSPGTVVDIEADMPDNSVFVRWDGDSTSLAAVEDVEAVSTKVTVGLNPITLTAVFEEISSVKYMARVPLTFDLRAASNGNVRFQVPQSEYVSIKVYDVRGRVVAVLSNGVKNPGFYSMNIAGARGGLGNGLYIVRMQSPSFSKNVRVNFSK